MKLKFLSYIQLLKKIYIEIIQIYKYVKQDLRKKG
jgi:hypothetical protein